MPDGHREVPAPFMHAEPAEQAPANARRHLQPVTASKYRAIGLPSVPGAGAGHERSSEYPAHELECAGVNWRGKGCLLG